VPRLRRVATVCGGDRFEFVQKQANEFLQLLLIMDVSRSGRLSYEEWVRGVLSLPEVLSCFELAINPAAERHGHPVSAPGSPSVSRGRGTSNPVGSPTRATHPSGHSEATGSVLVGFGSQRSPPDTPPAAALLAPASRASGSQRPSESLTTVHASLWWKSTFGPFFASLGCNV